MYKKSSSPASLPYGYGKAPAQGTPNCSGPGYAPGPASQNGAATVPAQAPSSQFVQNTMNAAPAAGYPGQPGVQPHRGSVAGNPQPFQQQQHQPTGMGNQPGFHPGTIPFNHGATAPRMQQPQAPAPNCPPPPQQAPNSAAEPAGYISAKICKINAKDKVVDFTSKLSVAKVEDFANVHGCGGTGHAANSTIAVTICDYAKKGKGEQSVTAFYNLDAEIMEVLYQAAMDARLGKLTANSADLAAAASVALHELNRWELAGSQQPVSVVPFAELTTTGKTLGDAMKMNNPAALQSASDHTLADLRRWASARKQCPSAGVPLREIYEVKTALTNALAQQDKPLFVYTTEKNNPYQKDAQGYVPVSKLYISYTPMRKNGEVSRYPWFIQIENFRAPLSTKATGASSHDASKAIDRKGVFINVSTDDFAQAMVAVKRYIRVWEMVATIPVVREGLKRLEMIKEGRKNKKEN